MSLKPANQLGFDFASADEWRGVTIRDARSSVVAMRAHCRVLGKPKLRFRPLLKKPVCAGGGRWRMGKTIATASQVFSVQLPVFRESHCRESERLNSVPIGIEWRPDGSKARLFFGCRQRFSDVSADGDPARQLACLIIVGNAEHCPHLEGHVLLFYPVSSHANA